MNSMTQPLLWCCLQVTVLSLAALAIGTVFSRRRPAAGAVVAASALFAVVGLTAMALSPWPSWPSNWDHVFGRHAATSGVLRDGVATSTSALKAAIVRPSVDGAIGDLPDSDPIGTGPESESLLQRLSDVAANNGFLALSVLYLVGLAAMAVRIAWGLAAVRGYRRDSLPLSDRRLLELVDVVRAELGCTRPIEVRASARSRTPATIGWRKPVLLLPLDWRAWTDEECLAVLAHEIEHVRRGDFASWVVAQFGLALHFLSPAGPLAGGPLAARARAGGRRGGGARAGRSAEVRDNARRDGATTIGRGRGVARPRLSAHIEDLSEEN